MYRNAILLTKNYPSSNYICICTNQTVAYLAVSVTFFDMNIENGKYLCNVQGTGRCYLWQIVPSVDSLVTIDLQMRFSASRISSANNLKVIYHLYIVYIIMKFYDFIKLPYLTFSFRHVYLSINIGATICIAKEKAHCSRGDNIFSSRNSDRIKN